MTNKLRYEHDQMNFVTWHRLSVFLRQQNDVAVIDILNKKPVLL